MEESNVIGKIIHEHRIKMGLTLEEVGNAVGVGKSTVKKWEDGFISNMKRDKISLLANILNLSPLTFITGVVTPKQSPVESSINSVSAISKQEQVLLDKFRKLNTNGKLKAIESVSDLTEINKYVNHVYIVKEAGRDGSFKDVTVTDEDVEGYYKLETPSDEI